MASKENWLKLLRLKNQYLGPFGSCQIIKFCSLSFVQSLAKDQLREVFPMTWPYEGQGMTLFTLYTLNHIVYSLHCTLYTVHCTLYTVHCILYTVHCRKIQWTEYIWGAQDDGVYVSQENCSLFLDDSAWLTVHCCTILHCTVLYCTVL